MNSLVLLVLLGLGLSLGAAMPAWAQSKSELVIALSSFSAETVDPALQGHNVKYYLSLMFDYLVGTTTDGQPSQAGGLASKWENSADHRRWTFHLRKGVKFHNGDEMTLEAEIHVLRGHLVAVVELHALAEVARPPPVVGRVLRLAGQPAGLRGLAVGGRADEIVEHERQVVLHVVALERRVDRLGREARQRDHQLRLRLRPGRHRCAEAQAEA